MRSLFTIALWLFLFNITGISQVWTFEYWSEKNTYCVFGSMLPGGKGSYHSIDVSNVPTSGKDIRGRLIQLDGEGNVVSLFRPQDCEAHNYYFPFMHDHVITVGPNCIDYGPFTFSIFDGEGRRTWSHPIDENYYFNQVIQYKDNVSFIQQSLEQANAENFLITSIDKDLKLTPHKIPLDQIKAPGHDLKMFHALQTGKEEYLLAVQIYDVDKDYAVHDLYSKLVLVNHGSIQWIKSLEHTLSEILCLGQVDNGFLIVGIDTNAAPLAMVFNLKGNEINRFAPHCISKGFHTRFYCTSKSLMVIDQRVRGSAMYISSYDLNGKKEWEKIIPTNYARLGNARIIGSDENSFLVDGSFAKVKEDAGHAFVMKFNFRDMISDTLDKIETVTKAFSENIIENVDREVTSVKVYPNPTQFELTFEIQDENSQREYVLTLYDISGKQVLRQKNTGSNFSVDISHLAPAVYVYNIYDLGGKQIVSGKIVKE